MKILKKSGIGIIVKSIAFSLMLPLTVHNSVNAGELDLDDRLNAKLARHKARATISQNTKIEEPSEDEFPSDLDDECSSIDIGTIDEPKPGFASHKPADIIITSDIINIDNKCKK